MAIKIIDISLGDLRPYEKNAKKHPQKQIDLLAQNIERFGFTTPVLIDKNNEVIAGHGRLLAMKQLGHTEVPCIRMEHLTETEVKALRLADSRIAELGEWDMDLALDELRELDEEIRELTGFDEDLLIDPSEKDDSVPELPETPVSERGDMYQLGDHVLLCGDSTSKEDMERLMDGVKADMVFTDPPYNVDYSGAGKKTSGKILNDKMSDEQFNTFLLEAFRRIQENVKVSAGWYVFHSHKTASDFERALEAVGATIDTQLTWNKPSAGMGMNDYRTKHEPFFYCYLKKDEKKFYGDRTGTTVWKIPQDELKALKWFERIQESLESGNSTVWSVNRANTSEYVHPTQKPVELPAVAMQKSSKRQDIILDTFLGSGTTLIAAQKTDRICYGMELDPKFVDVIVQRYVDYSGDKKIIRNGQVFVWKSK